MASSKKTDKVVLELQEQVAQKKALLAEGAKKFSPITNCMLTIDNERFNLNTINKHTILLLCGKLDGINIAVQTRFPGEVVEISGFSIEDWLTDLSALYIKVNRAVEAKRLVEIEKRLAARLSSEKQTELELDQLAKELSK